jgi:hypothetical protein
MLILRERLSGEIAFRQDRWLKLKDDGEAGQDVRLTLENARRTIADIESRLEGRRSLLSPGRSPGRRWSTAQSAAHSCSLK